MCADLTDAEPENRMVPRRVDTATPDPVDEWPGGSEALELPPIEDLEKAQKHDTDKAPLAWVSSEFIEGTAKVLAFGGNKYAPGNWSKGGFTYTQLTSAILRHLLAANSGEDLDPESGLPHLYHASCGLMFLSTHCERGSIVDDRAEKGVAVDD